MLVTRNNVLINFCFCSPDFFSFQQLNQSHLCISIKRLDNICIKALILKGKIEKFEKHRFRHLCRCHVWFMIFIVRMVILIHFLLFIVQTFSFQQLKQYFNKTSRQSLCLTFFYIKLVELEKHEKLRFRYLFRCYVLLTSWSFIV